MDVVGAVLEQDEPCRVGLQARRGDLVIEVAVCCGRHWPLGSVLSAALVDRSADGELVTDELAVGRPHVMVSPKWVATVLG